jgi:hypothetical protein
MFTMYDVVSLFDREEEVEVLDRAFTDAAFDKYLRKNIITKKSGRLFGFFSSDERKTLESMTI